MLTTEQAAERLGVSRHTVRRWYVAGRLKGIQLGGPQGRIKITEESVAALLAPATKEPQQ